MLLTGCLYSKQSLNNALNLGIIIKLPGKLNYKQQDSGTDGDNMLWQVTKFHEKAGYTFFQSFIFQNTKVLQPDT